MALSEQTRGQMRTFLHSTRADHFEALIGELLIAIGFDEGTVEVTSYHGDGGIDVRGILNAGGITRVNAAVQVKRWKANIPAPTVRDVRSSLTTQEQGIIITTSDFSKGAKIEANAIGKTPISLVNGGELLELLIEHGIGVEREQHTVLSLDEEFWGELTEPTEPASPTPALENSPQEKIESPPATTTSPIKAKVKYPLLVRAMNSDKTALLLNAEGHMRFDGQEYTSVSTAGAEASGWKACNGWKFWQYQDPNTKEWRPIDVLRQVE